MNIINAIGNIIMFLLGMAGLFVSIALTTLFVCMAILLHDDGLATALLLLAGAMGGSSVLYGVGLHAMLKRDQGVA